MMGAMDTNLIALVLSFAFLAVVIGASLFARHRWNLAGESMRKIIHIGVSNWWFILLFGFDRLAFAVVGPILFIIVNLIFVLGNWAVRLGFGSQERNWGLVYYPLILLLFVLCHYQGFLHPLSTTVAVLVMGYGDGLAALIGTKWGVREIPFQLSKKSYLGSITMWTTATVIIALGLLCYGTFSTAAALIIAVLFGAIITAVEVITPFGLDNITVPMVAALLMELLV
ncbi:MAG TPA: hypothetical protein VFC80_05945 [Sphaerochaeta sp.]|nr:hypothetical protein [Sphaerochaeta sp.]